MTCKFCGGTGTLLNIWDNPQDCPVCKNKLKQDQCQRIIKKLMKQRGMTLEDLSQRLGITQQQILRDLEVIG